VRPFRTGDFDRSLVHGVYHPFLPAHAANSLHEISLEALQAKGKRLLLLDVDNTLVQWKQENFSQPVLDWIARAKEMGFEICVLSNTRRVERLRRLSELLGVETVRGRFKPSRAMFRLALMKFRRKPEEAIMIGDQIFTDVLGANRSGIDAIWVRRMEGKEFGPTSISRMGERILSGGLYRALVTPVDEPTDTTEPMPLKERPIFRQFIKFCIVGGTSFVIDTGLTMLLMRMVSFNGVLLSTMIGDWMIQNVPLVSRYAATTEAASAPILGGFAAIVAMFNSFVWNRSWTFRVKGKEERLAQLRRFYLISILGAILSTIIFSGVYNGLGRHTSLGIIVAKVVAAGIVAIWNFAGQRLYAFRTSPA
jgi:HAD superfamily phosphatase (TIGR01668 family)